MVVSDRNTLEQAEVQRKVLYFKDKVVPPKTQEQEAAILPGRLGT